MPELEKPESKTSFKSFLKIALSSVDAGIEEIKGKGTSVRLDKDYCNSVVEALHSREEFKDFSETEIKMALKPLFKAVVLNTVAKELGIIEQ